MSRKNYHNILLGTLLCCIPVLQPLKAQTPSTANQLKAVFLYNFSQFVDWPPASFSSSSSPFVIGILGRDPFGSYMESVVQGEKVGTHPIVVERYSSAGDVKACHILFINTSEPSSAIRELKNRTILTVGDQKNFAKLGGMIRFFIENNKIRLQINLRAARAANLNISSKLLRVAEVIN